MSKQKKFRINDIDPSLLIVGQTEGYGLFGK